MVSSKKDFPICEALDTIRHEYAHFMDFEIYGNSGHGKTWKMCCQKVGAYPNRLYNEERAKISAKIQRQKEETLKRYDTDYYVGQRILHPVYDEGNIISFDGEGFNKRVIVLFDNQGTKELALKWLDKYCIVIDDIYAERTK